MTDIPNWLIQIHRENLFALQNCINNPSPDENELAIEMYKTLLSHDSGFSDFKYIILNEWQVNPEKPWLGKGDLAFTNGKNILVVEVKRIKGYTKQLKLQKLTKVIRQARYYALMIMKFRDRQRFPIPEYNQYFRKSKIHAAFYTNLDKNIILVKHPKRISSSNKKRLIDLPRNLTTQEVINTNKLNVELVEEQTPVHQKFLSSQVKIEENQTQKQNIQLTKENPHQQQLYLKQQPKYNRIEESKDNEIIFLNHINNIENTPQNKIKSSNSALKKFDDVITIKTDSKNRKFLVDSNNWDQKERIEISSEKNINSKKQSIIDKAIKPYFKNNTTTNNQSAIKNDIIFLNEIKPYKKQSPDLIFLNSISIPIQSESPKMIPFNMSLALQQNFDINCSLSQLTVPQQQKEVAEDDYCDVSLCSFIDIASFDLDNSYLQVNSNNNNNDLSSRQQKQSSILLGAYNNNQQLNQQPLKNIVQQKLLEFKDNTQIINNLNKKDKGLSQLDKIIIEQNDIFIEINDSNIENNQKYDLPCQEQKDNDCIQYTQIQDKDFDFEQIVNNQIDKQDQRIILPSEVNNSENILNINALKIVNIQQNNNLDNQNNMHEKHHAIQIINSIEDNEQNQLIKNQISLSNQNYQAQACQNDSFYEFMLKQILIQEQIQEIQNEQQLLQDEKKVMLDKIDQQISPILRKQQNLFRQCVNKNLSTADNTIITLNQLNSQNEKHQIVLLSEQEILQDNGYNTPNQQKRRQKKIIKADKKKFQENIDEENSNLDFIQEKTNDQSKKPFKIIRKCGISVIQSQSCYEQLIAPQQELNHINNYNIEHIKHQNEQDIIVLKNSSPCISQNIQNKVDKKIKIIKPDEIFKGKKINIVYKQPCREKKQQFIEIS
ncbi:hypothetical protein ABPG72_009769 [Tetrahymena utriculariae]